MVSPDRPDVRTCLFSTSPLDRLNNLRHSQTLLSAALPSNTLHLLFSPNLHLLFHTNFSLALLPSSDLPFCPQPTPSTHPIILLGVSDNIAYHAIRLPPTFDTNTYLTNNPNFKFFSLRTASPHIPHHHAAFAAHARSLFEFHIRHKYCGLCASPTISDHAGSRRRCTRNITAQEPHIVQSHLVNKQTCNGICFPRSDPVVIMLVLHPSHQTILLGRAARHPPNFYSCLAGFMEHGEGLEDAVRREVREEAGIRVGRVRFFGSQPWPFPYSLMLGCVALADDTTITIDKHELEDAHWFDRDEVARMVEFGRAGDASSDLAVPPASSIAGVMCAAFAQSDPITSFPSSSPSQSPASGML